MKNSTVPNSEDPEAQNEPAPTATRRPNRFDPEEAVRAKVAAGLTREQAIEVVKTQIEHDRNQ